MPKNLQITEYPRIQRTIRKEQKRTEIDIIDSNNNKKEEINIMDTINRNINIFPNMPTTQPIIPIQQEVEKNEEKVQKKDEYDFLKQFGKQKDDNSKELLDLIQTVIEDDPNQIKMFQQKIKDDEIKSGKKIEAPPSEEEDEADIQAIENYKKKVQNNMAQFRKNRKNLNIAKLLENSKKKNISIAEKRLNLMKDKNNNDNGVVNLLDNDTITKNLTGRNNRRRRGQEKKNDDEEYKLEEEGNNLNEQGMNIVQSMNKELKSINIESKNRNSIKSMLGAPTEEEMELVNNIARGRRNKKRNVNNNTNKIQNQNINDENNIVTLDDNDDDNEEQNISNIPQIKKVNNKAKKKKGKGKKQKNEITEITLGDSDDVDGTVEDTNEALENNNNNVNINNLGEVNVINEMNFDTNNNINSNINEKIPEKNNLNIGLIDNTKEISIYNPSAVFSNNLANNIAKMENNTNNISNTNTMINKTIPEISPIPLKSSISAEQKEFISSLLSTLIKHYGYDTLVNSIVHRKKSSNVKLDEFVEFLLKNNSYPDVLTCLLSFKKSEDITQYPSENQITINPMKTKKQINKENIMSINNSITTSTLLNKKKEKEEDIEVIGLEGDAPSKRRRKNNRWTNRKTQKQKNGVNNLKNNNNVVSLDEEEDEVKINLDDNSGNNLKKSNRNNTKEKMIDITPTQLGDHYHKGKDGMIFRYVFNSLKNDNIAIYDCSEENCKSKAILKIKEQEFILLNDHISYYLHKDLSTSIINDKNIKLMNRKGYQDVQISAEDEKEIEWIK